jgi:two-component system sensor histidine kinase CpxA
VPVPGAGGLCLGAVAPPRPKVLGLFPSSLWYVLPALELLCCGIVSFFLARYLAEPILRTREAAVAFAAGDLSARALPAQASRRRDEAADLAQEFNRMADRVAAMIGAQQRFIGDVSHEIRSPLGRLALTLGLARREAAPHLLARLDRMEQELDAVSSLVHELLVLASLQGSVCPPVWELINLPDMLDRVVDDLTYEFHERGHSIRTIRQPGRVVVKGDSALLRRAVDNVLRNALFYTPDDTEVEMIVEADGDWARLVVRDHGPGVPEAALPQLFEPFFRVDQARARNTGGAGLGLAISQRAVELHGGRIRAANALPHGLTVRIDLPVAVS